MLEDKVKQLEKQRDKLEKELKKDLRDKEKFFAGQLDLLSKLKVSEEEQPKIQEQKDAIERQKSEEMEAISRAAQTELNSMYAKINLLTEFIADGFELKKK